MQISLAYFLYKVYIRNMKSILTLIILAITGYCGANAYVSISELMAVHPTVEVIGGRVCLNDN